jgi:hypothetical protein
VVFVGVWRITMAAAAVVVLIDHRKTIRDLDLKTSTVLRRWSSYSRLAERLVVNSRRDAQLDLPILEGMAHQAAGFR